MKVFIVNKGTIPEVFYGGTERVIWYLGKELVKLGHAVSYLTNKGSTCDFGDIVPIDESQDIIRQIPSDVDIVHFNSALPNIQNLRKPYIITIHGNSKS